MRRSGGLAVPGLLALALAACRVPPPDLAADPGELLAALRARQDRLRRVAGTASVRLDGPGARGTARALVAAEKPDRLRVELLDFFGNPVLSLAVADGRFALRDTRSGRWLRGPARAGASLLPGAPPPDELVAALCGSARLAGAPEGAVDRGGLRQLRLVEGGVEREISVGEQGAVEGVRSRRGGGGPDLAFGRFRTLGWARFPFDVAFLAGGRELTFRWGDDLALNGPRDPDLFSLVPPPGAAVEEWDGAGPPPLDLPLGE